MGQLPQVKEVIHNCHTSNDPNFIDSFPFKKIDATPILSNVVLNDGSKKTDLIIPTSIGFSFGSIVISNELKKIMENFNCFGVQFFPTFIIYKGKRIDNYWQTHFYESPYDYIDFKNTDLLLKDRDENRKLVQKSLQRAENKEDFLKKLSSFKYPKMLVLRNITFKKEMNLDFFFLQNFSGANHGIVSDRLKIAIDIQQITGSEFKPMKMDSNAWFGTNGMREKIYGPIPQARSNGSTNK